MEDGHKHSLHQPLIPFFSPSAAATTTSTSSSSSSSSSSTFVFTAATTSSYSLPKTDQHDQYNDITSDRSIFLRILLILLVAVLSIWANYEASKTFEVYIVNDAKDSLAGRRFDLSYVANDKAVRIILNTSSFVQHILYPYDNNPYKKHIDRVTLRLTRRNLNATATVSAAGNHHSGGGKFFNGYVIDISPSLLEEANYNNKIKIEGAIQRAMARVWLWDGESRAPPELVDGMAEYIAELAGFRRELFPPAAAAAGGRWLPECEGHDWWESKDPVVVARYLHYCEEYKTGFIQRLNEAMRDTWHDQMVDDALGIPTKKLCGGLHNALRLRLI